MTRLALLASGTALLLSSAAMAQDSGGLSAEFTIELENDTLFDSTNPANELSDTYATIGAALSLALSAHASLNTSLVLEPIIDAVDDRAFEDHGLYAEELYYAHDFGAAQIVLGKFNPAFGTAWDAAPGIYGADFAEDYELTEQLGGAVTVPFDIGGTQNELTLAIFQADRTILSKSLGRKRPQNALNAGGVTNTDGPESMSLSLDGVWGDSTYNLSLQHLGRGVGDVADQTGISVGMTHSYDLGVPVSLLAELAYFGDFGGTGNAARYGTVGLAAPVGPVTVSGVYSNRDIAGAPTDHLGTLSAEMELFAGLTGAVGYRFGREGGDKNQTIGTLLVYEF